MAGQFLSRQGFRHPKEIAPLLDRIRYETIIARRDVLWQLEQVDLQVIGQQLAVPKIDQSEIKMRVVNAGEQSLDQRHRHADCTKLSVPDSNRQPLRKQASFRHRELT